MSEVETPQWSGNSTQDYFSITKSDLEESKDAAREWRKTVRILEGEESSGNVIMILGGNAPPKNSEISNDGNKLHKYSQVVSEFIEKADHVARETHYDGEVLINQGMSFIDGLEEKLEGPVREISGRWRDMVYVPVDGEKPTQILLEEQDEGFYRPFIYPKGNEDLSLQERGDNESFIQFEYADEEERSQYTEDHNEKMIRVMDMAVGRSRDTPENVRDGELLLDNKMYLNKIVDWDRLESLDFHREKLKEEGYAVSQEWRIDVEYEDGEIAEDAMRYQEKSTYWDRFHELETVQVVEEDNQEVANPMTAVLTTCSDSIKNYRQEIADAREDIENGDYSKGLVKATWAPWNAAMSQIAGS